MLARIHAIFFFFFALCASASVLPRGGGGGGGGGGTSCNANTGTQQCCNSVQSPTSSSIAGLLGLLGIVVGTLTADVGVTCSPITVIGAGGTSCNQQAVCCTDNSFNGLVALGCSPININL